MQIQANVSNWLYVLCNVFEVPLEMCLGFKVEGEACPGLERNWGGNTNMRSEVDCLVVLTPLSEVRRK